MGSNSSKTQSKNNKPINRPKSAKNKNTITGKTNDIQPSPLPRASNPIQNSNTNQYQQNPNANQYEQNSSIPFNYQQQPIAQTQLNQQQYQQYPQQQQQQQQPPPPQQQQQQYNPQNFYYQQQPDNSLPQSQRNFQTTAQIQKQNGLYQDPSVPPQLPQPVRPLPQKQTVQANENLQLQRKTAMISKPGWGDINDTSLNKPVYDIQKWKALIAALQENLKLINYVYSRPRRSFKSINELGVFFRNSPAQSEIEIAWVIYVWISQNIDYDVNSFRTGLYNDMDLEPEGVLETGRTISWGYAKLFEQLCRMNDLECISISGFAKGLSYRQNHAFIDPNHEWNAVKLNGVWQLVDCTWGTGYVSDDFVFYRKFIPYYFLTPPQIFIYDHYSEQYQLQAQKMSVRRFEKLPLLKLEFFLNDVRCLSHDIYTSIRPIERNFKMEFACADDTILLASLERTNGELIERSVLVQYDQVKNHFEFLMTLPNGKDSVLNIFTRKNGEESQFCGEVYIFAPMNIEASVISVSQDESESEESELEEVYYPVQLAKPKPKMIRVEPAPELVPRKEWNLDLKEKGRYEIHLPPDYDIQVKDKFDYFIQDKSGRRTKLMMVNENDHR